MDGKLLTWHLTTNHHSLKHFSSSSPVTAVAEPVLTPLGINRLLNPYQMILFLVLA
jgi:hypothetical protein